MTNRMILLLTLVTVVVGVAIIFIPRLEEQVMIGRLRGSGQGAVDALNWLIRHRGVAAFDLAYAHGSPDILRYLPSAAYQLSMPNFPVHPSAEDLGRRLTDEELLTILLHVMQMPDQNARDSAGGMLCDIQRMHPVLTAQNVQRLLPLLKQPFSLVNPLWNMLEASPDSRMLDAIPDAVYEQGLSGKDHDQVVRALKHKYSTHAVRWKHGTAGIINLPNPVLLALMQQSPSIRAQADACLQLACNYDAVASHEYARTASCNPLRQGYGARVEYHYAGPPLRNNRAVEKEMGISTAEVIKALEKDFTHFPIQTDFDGHHHLWWMLTGEKR